MHRRRLLSLVAAAPLFSGCSTISPSRSADSPSESANSPPEDSVLAKRGSPTRDELPTESRPPAEEPADATEDTVSPREYPTKPTEYTDQSVRTFVESHERAFVCNDFLARTGTHSPE